MTLTCNPARHESPEAGFQAMTTAVTRLFKRLRRRYPHSEIQYALVWETTKSGWPHAHMLLRAPFIPQARLSSIWADLTGAPIVDIRPVRTQGQAVAYVSKYLTKDPSVPFGFRRYRFSRLYSDKLPVGILAAMFGVDKWLRVQATLEDSLKDLTARGLRPFEHLPELWVCLPP